VFKPSLLVAGVIAVIVAGIIATTIVTSPSASPPPPTKVRIVPSAQTHRGKTARQWYKVALHRLYERDHARSKAGEAIRYSRKLQRTLDRFIAVRPSLIAPTVLAIARSEAARLGVVGSLWDCLSSLISRENANPPSAWNPGRWNGAGSGAYGLPQALPGDKMASEGSDWFWNPATQVRWMIGYSKSRYGGVCEANAYQLAHHSY